MLVAEFLVVPFIAYRVYRTPLGAFHAGFTLVVQASGVDVAGPFPVRRKLFVHDKTRGTMRAALFGDEKIMEPESAEPGGVCNVAV
jgi:hypothetical protein